jgi:hypothetical protein
VIIQSIPRIHIASQQQQMFFQPPTLSRQCSSQLYCCCRMFFVCCNKNYSFVCCNKNYNGYFFGNGCVFSQLKDSRSTTVSMSRSAIFRVYKDRSLRSENWETLNRHICLVYSALRVDLPSAYSTTSLLV